MASQMDFQVIKKAVAAQWAKMQKHQLFRTAVEKDDVYARYLSAFPEGTNPVYRERTEHDCSCCKSFIRAVGNVVALVNGMLVSIWDVSIPEEPAYQTVCDELAKLVKSGKIEDVFLHFENRAGVDKTFEEMVSGVHTWNHFFVNIDAKFVKANADIPTALARPRESKEVFLRSVNEITEDSIETVLDLIAQDSLYRGAEHKKTLTEFLKLKKQGDKLTETGRERFGWTTATSGISEAILRIRNTSIGTLLTDLSEDTELEAAVKKFESKVAPENYKRPTALVTPKMIQQAQATIEELGLTSALQRRHAQVDDISVVNNVIFANRSTKKKLNASVFDDLVAETTKVNVKQFDKVEEISIDKFLADVVPRVDSIEVLVENKHQANLMSMVAPVDPTAGSLFAWDNNFSWSYYGELADSSLRKAVQAKGGRVDGAFRFSHTWNYDKRNASLMDLHVFMPGNGTEAKNGMHEQYGNLQRVGWNHRNHAASGGSQDVDYVKAAPEGYVPVENISFPDIKRMPEGTYVCKIHNWNLRQPTVGGFKAEIEFGGQVFEYEYDKPLKHHEWITVAEVTLKNGEFTIKHHLKESTSAREIWGMQTQQFHPVSLLINSPNHWDGKQTGNKHTFFILEGCKNNESARGFYNEYIRPSLNTHRKVFELLGSKLKVEQSDQQLSGLGFSSTQRNSVVVRVKGNTSRILKVAL
jgi:hypothetical protein